MQRRNSYTKKNIRRGGELGPGMHNPNTTPPKNPPKTGFGEYVPTGQSTGQSTGPSIIDKLKDVFSHGTKKNDDFTGIVPGTKGGKSRKLRKSRKLSNKKR